MNIKLFLFSFFCFLECGNSALAEEFYWVGYYGKQHVSSADAACINEYKVLNGPGAGGVYTYLGLVFSAESMFYCGGNLKDGISGIVTYGRAFGIAFRRGDSCAANMLYNKDSGACYTLAGESKGESVLQVCAVSRINLASGNVYEVQESLQSKPPVLLSGYMYNSLDGTWRHSYSTRLQISGTGVTRTTASGQEFYYTVNGAAVTAQTSALGELSKLADGWTYTSPSNEVFDFDVNGKLTQQISETGQLQQLSYNGNTIIVSDPLGRSITITEDALHQPLALTAPGVSVQYSYDANQRLVQVTRTQGGQIDRRQYHYEDARNNALLTGITDERGVRNNTWEYDDQGRVISSQSANGAGLTTVVYNSDGTRKVTNQLGKSTLYRFVDAGGVKRISAVEGEPSANCPASNSTFTYNDRGQVLTKTDAKGFITTYTYNTRGLEATRTEATGTSQARTTTTTWHATFNLPLTVTEAGQVTTYTYDAQGRQTSRAQTAP